MRKVLSITFIVSLIILFSGCSPKSYHNEMLDNTKRSLGKKDYQDIKTSYTEELVNEVKKQKEYISILEDKSLGDILKEMELLDGNFYFLKSSDILIPKSRIKIHSMSELNHYLNAVLDKELFVKKVAQFIL